MKIPGKTYISGIINPNNRHITGTVAELCHEDTTILIKLKYSESERDICTQFILPALVKAGWNVAKQVREEVFFTDGRIFVKGSKTTQKG